MSFGWVWPDLSVRGVFFCMRVVVMRVDLVSLAELVVDLGALLRRLSLLTLGR